MTDFSKVKLNDLSYSEEKGSIFYAEDAEQLEQTLKELAKKQKIKNEQDKILAQANQTQKEFVDNPKLDSIIDTFEFFGDDD